MCGQSDMLAVEEYTGNTSEEKPKVLWSESDTIIKVNDVAGCCSLVMSIPPLHPEPVQYHEHFLETLF
jgi:hypothetical protein